MWNEFDKWQEEYERYSIISMLWGICLGLGGLMDVAAISSIIINGFDYTVSLYITSISDAIILFCMWLPLHIVIIKYIKLVMKGEPKL